VVISPALRCQNPRLSKSREAFRISYSPSFCVLALSAKGRLCGLPIRTSQYAPAAAVPIKPHIHFTGNHHIGIKLDCSRADRYRIQHQRRRRIIPAQLQEEQAGVTAFLTQAQHLDLGIVFLPTSDTSKTGSASAIARHYRGELPSNFNGMCRRS
jgi:hypothetical protein